MVTMNSEKAAVKRKPEPNNGGCMKVNEEAVTTQPVAEESPNHLLYKKVRFHISYSKDFPKYTSLTVVSLVADPVAVLFEVIKFTYFVFIYC